MAVMFIEKDPFVEGIASVNSDYKVGENVMVRRPLYGISIKAPKFAWISVLTAENPGGDLKPVSIIDSSAPGGYSNSNHNFILNGVEIGRQEKAQIMTTFGAPYLFFFGESPQFLKVNGALLNTRDFNWKNEWLRNYDKYLRGSRCVETKSRVYLGFDDTVVSGYVLNTSVSFTSETQYICPFSFSMILTEYIDLSVGDNSYVQKSEHARTQGTNDYVEYVTSSAEGVNIKLGEIGTDGAWAEKGSISDAPGAVDHRRSASWLSPVENNPEMPSTEKKDVYREVILRRYMQENSVDRTEAIFAMSENPSSMPISSREFSKDISSAMGGGVSNFCGVIS